METEQEIRGILKDNLRYVEYCNSKRLKELGIEFCKVKEPLCLNIQYWPYEKKFSITVEYQNSNIFRKNDLLVDCEVKKDKYPKLQWLF